MFRDAATVAAVLFALVGTGMTALWFATKSQLSHFDRVEIITSIWSFIPDQAWYLSQLLLRNGRIATLSVVIVAHVAFVAVAANRVNQGIWPLGVTVACFVVLVVVELVIALVFCTVKENDSQGWRKC